MAVLLMVGLSTPLAAQKKKPKANSQANQYRLAQQYARNGEFEKAASVYKRLFEGNPKNATFFTSYYKTLLQMDDFAKAEDILKARIKQFPKDPFVYVSYGELNEKMGDSQAAQKNYRKATDLLPNERHQVVRLANQFKARSNYEMAQYVYEKGSKKLNDEYLFAWELGDLYRQRGENKEMIYWYLNSVEREPNRVTSVKTIFQRYLSEDAWVELKEQLYIRAQENPESDVFPDMLAYVFIQQKDFNGALRQVRAIDRRKKENGTRIYELANKAAMAKDFDAAIKAYEYIVEKKGKDCPFYTEAKRGSLRSKRNKLVNGFAYTQEEMLALDAEYEAFLEEFGRTRGAASLIAEQADLAAFYLNDLPKAVKLLEEVVAMKSVPRITLAKAKLSLGDFYLMDGNIWEATLLYSQVDKAFKEDVLGQDARYRNARLSYYNGDFEWAQSQFDILKASTSRPISNDAIDMSVFIMTHLGLDTTAVPMQEYAKADLLIFQNRFEEAFVVLDKLVAAYPEHELIDDIYYSKAGVYTKRREYEKAAEMYNTIIAESPDGIRADNAIFLLAKLYDNENQLNEPSQAMELYKKIIMEYSGSTFVVESRERFRSLRGEGD